MVSGTLTAIGTIAAAAGSIIASIFGYKNHALGTQIHINTNSRYDELKAELMAVRADAKVAAEAAIQAAVIAKTAQKDHVT
jgi:hypothetical protein